MVRPSGGLAVTTCFVLHVVCRDGVFHRIDIIRNVSVVGKDQHLVVLLVGSCHSVVRMLSATHHSVLLFLAHFNTKANFFSLY